VGTLDLKAIDERQIHPNPRDILQAHADPWVILWVKEGSEK
jgi:hypothetical protein